MNIPRVWKWIVGTVGTIGILITGIERIVQAGSSFWRDLNPWTLTFCLFAAMLVALGVASYIENLNAHFSAHKKAIQEEGVNRHQEIQSASQEFNRMVSNLGSQLDLRLGNVWQECDERLKALSGKLDAERKNAESYHSTAMTAIGDLQSRVAKLQRPTSSSASGVQS